MKFLSLYGARMPNIEFDKLKAKIEVAKTLIVHQAEEIAALKAAQTPVAPVPDVTDADYVALTKGLDDVLSAVVPAASADSPVGAPVHPNLV